MSAPVDPPEATRGSSSSAGRSASARPRSRAGCRIAVATWFWSRRTRTRSSSFYRDPAGRRCRPSCFLFQRAQQLAAAPADLFAPTRIADYLIGRFAPRSMRWSSRVYGQVHAKLAIEAPDLLPRGHHPAGPSRRADGAHRAPPHPDGATSRARLPRQTRPTRASFTASTRAPLLIVNAATIDPIGSPADFEELLARSVG